eukprot:gene7966-9360_t
MDGYGYPGASSLPKNPPAPIPAKVSEPIRPRTTSAPQPVHLSIPPKPQSNALLSQSAPLWDLEKTVPGCSACYLPFTVIRRRFNHNDAVRVCLYCFIHNTDHDKTCLSRLIPYLADFHRDAQHQYQALLEIYDFLLSNQSNTEKIEISLVGGLKSFIDFISRTIKENHKSESVAVACQILSFTSKYEKLNRAITDPEHLSVLFDLMACSDNPSVRFDCAKTLKNVLSTVGRPTKLSAPSTPVTVPAGAVPAAAAVPEVPLRFSAIVNKPHIVQMVSLIENPTSKEDFQLECLRILRVLAHDEEMLAFISQSNVIEVVTPLLSSPKSSMIKSALKVLTRLSILDKKNAEKFYSIQEPILLIFDQVLEFNGTNQALHKLITANNEFVTSLIGSLKNATLEPLCLSILNQLCTTDESKESLRVHGLIDPILSMMCDKNKNIVLPLEILSRIALNNEKACYTIQNQPVQDIMSPGANVPYSGDIEETSNINADREKHEMFKRVQYNTVKLVGNLSHSKNIVQEFVHFENGAGVKALVALLNPSVDEKVKEVASEALSNLCENEACSIVVLSEGGLTYSMALLSSSNTVIKTNALRLLQRLAAHSPEIKLAISEGTSIRQIVEMLSNQSPDLKKCAIFSLAELCKDNASNREQAYKFGCLPILVSSFNTYVKDPRSIVCLLEVLSGFAGQSDQFCSILLNTDLVQSIIEYLFNSMDASDSDNFVTQSKVYSVLILSQLISSAEQVRKIIDSGIILSLVPLLSVKNSYLQEYTLTVLRTISRNSSSDLRETLITSGILVALSDLLVSKNESILVNTLTILGELSKSPECGGYLLSTPAIALVAELIIAPSTPAPAKPLAVALVSSLFDKSASNSNIWEVFTAKAGIPGLVALLSSTNVMAQVTAANALSSIVVDGPGRARVVESGGLPALVAALSSSNPNVTCAALVTVLGLSLEDELCESIVKFGALSSLLNILSSNEYTNPNLPIDARLYACETIFNLASNDACRALICDIKLVIKLLDLLFSGANNYKVVASKTIAMLAADPSTAKLVYEQGGVIGLIPLLADQPDSDENTIMSAAIALTNLARHLDDNCKLATLSIVDEHNNPGVLLITTILASKSKNSSQKIKLQLLDLLQIVSDHPEFAQQFLNNPDALSNLLLLLTNTVESLPSTATSSDVKSPTSPAQGEESQHQLLIMFKILSIVMVLSLDPKTRDLLIDKGCLTIIPKLMTPPPEMLVSLDSLSGLSLLDMPTKEPEVHAHINLNSTEDCEEINKLCLSLIYTFSFTFRGKNEFRSSSMIKSILRFLDSKIEEQVCSSLRILYNLSISTAVAAAASTLPLLKTPPSHYFDAKYLYSGGIAGIVSRTLTAPLERLKILNQVQPLLNNGTKYNHIASGLRTIYAEEGLRGLFKGNGANVLKAAPQSAIRFFSYEAYKNIEYGQEQVQTTEIKYRGIVSTMQTVVREEGPTGLFRGLSAGIWNIAPFAALNFAAYETCKDVASMFIDKPPFYLSTVYGAISGAFSMTVLYPLDVVKRRIMMQGYNGSTTVYRGTLHAFYRMIKDEGVSSLYRGIKPAYVKVIPT